MPSSSRNRSKGNRLPPSQSTQYPTVWSEWEWNETYKQYYRYRKIAETGAQSDYEYEYQKSNEAPRSQNSDPAVTLAALSQDTAAKTPETIEEDTQSDPEYTSNPPVDELNASFRRTGLSTVNEEQTPAPAAQFKVTYSQDREKANNFTAGQSPQSIRGRRVFGAGGRFVRIKDSSTDFEPLNPNFLVHPSSAFAFGRVFKILWSEPTGSTGTIITGFQQAKYGEKAYHSTRRFMIVDWRHPGHSICLPILTYSGQGTTKKGVRDSTHAIIFTGKWPVTLKGEKMTKSPVKMTPDSPEHHLDRASRINYAKLYTVEHNVKVQFIGSVKGSKYQQQVTVDYNNTHPALPEPPDDASDNDFIQMQGQDPQYPQATAHPTYPVAGVSSVPTSSAYGPVAGWSTKPNSQTYSSYAPQGTYVTSQPSTGTPYYTYGGPSTSTKPPYDYSTSPSQVSYSEGRGNVMGTAGTTTTAATPVEPAVEEPEEEAVAIEPKYDEDDLYD